jgi:heme/copper-type cytochrome/quinol oxidase subunit 2
MNPMWMAVTYLVGRARCRAQAAREGHPESGALSLEWLVIAVALVVAVGIAAVIFNNAIQSETANLP